MLIEDLKNQISEQTGVPVSLLTGETAEETISQAKALIMYKKETDTIPKNKREQFADWFYTNSGIDGSEKYINDSMFALSKIEESTRYPVIKDNTSTYSSEKTSIDIFRDMLYQSTTKRGRDIIL